MVHSPHDFIAYHEGMTTSSSSHTTGHCDLADRTSVFARNARAFVRKTPRTLASLGDCRQLIRSTGAVGSAYIDADSADSRDSFLRAIFDCRTQAKQAQHWLKLLDDGLDERSEELRGSLLKEAGELERIFGAIVKKVLEKNKAKAVA